MDIRLLEFADYATFTDDRKLIISGIFNRINVRRKPDVAPDAPLTFMMPTGFLCWVVESSIGDGLKHQVTVRVVSEDGDEVLRSDLGEMNFIMDKAGRPMRFQGRLMVGGLPLPGTGDFVFELLVDGSKLGETTLYVDESPPPNQ